MFTKQEVQCLAEYSARHCTSFVTSEYESLFSKFHIINTDERRKSVIIAMFCGIRVPVIHKERPGSAGARTVKMKLRGE